MCRTTQKRSQPKAIRSAFTLVEMLVSVTLVLMMMTLFASIFQIATGAMGKQRGISEQDQRARSLTTVIRKDFQHRTMRYPFAFYPGEDSSTSPTPFPSRSGYFYLSTNDPNSGLDDIVQFTVSANILSEDPDGTPFFGSAAELVDRRPMGAATTGLSISPNQPETDDGSVNANGFGTSPAAEICYFIRHGNLYRRVVLIREPLAFAGQNLSPQPTSQSGYDYFFGQPDTTDNTTYDGMFQPNGLPLTNDFYRLFDYSAYSLVRPGGFRQASFLGIASLSNETTGAASEILAFPNRRFGFNPITGLSREHSSVGAPFFLGRFVQAETSTLNFNYPQALSTNEPADPLNASIADLGTLSGTNGNPLDVAGSPLTLNASNGIVSAFDANTTPGAEGRGGVRRMEDLLLANVHEMKIELWDDRLQRYVTPGHSDGNLATGQRGDYHISRCLNHDYRVLPGSSTLAVGSIGKSFDTWHPFQTPLSPPDFNSDGSISLSERNPPYLPYNFYPPLPPTGPPLPTTFGTYGIPVPVAPATEDPRNKGYWTANNAYGLNDVVFVPWIDSSGDSIFQYAEIAEPKFTIAYRCITAGTTAATQPTFSTHPGRRISDGTCVWESVDNRRPLKSIRLQIRFYDKTSDSMRQLSLVIPMTEVK